MWGVWVCVATSRDFVAVELQSWGVRKTEKEIEKLREKYRKHGQYQQTEALGSKLDIVEFTFAYFLRRRRTLLPAFAWDSHTPPIRTSTFVLSLIPSVLTLWLRLEGLARINVSGNEGVGTTNACECWNGTCKYLIQNTCEASLERE